MVQARESSPASHSPSSYPETARRTRECGRIPLQHYSRRCAAAAAAIAAAATWYEAYPGKTRGSLTSDASNKIRRYALHTSSLLLAVMYPYDTFHSH